jgi:hypothetical protein
MNLFRTISVFALAFLVLLSSSSFIVGLHFCGGQVAHVALLSEADKCAMEKSLPTCHKQVTTSCCDDETIVHEAEGFKAASHESALIPLIAVDQDLTSVIISSIIPENPVAQNFYDRYDPPLRSYDRVVSLQVFLI